MSERDECEMKIVLIDDAVDRMLISDVMLTANERMEELRVAYDPIDEAIKVKVGQGIWSRPFGVKVEH